MFFDPKIRILCDKIQRPLCRRIKRNTTATIMLPIPEYGSGIMRRTPMPGASMPAPTRAGGGSPTPNIGPPMPKAPSKGHV